MKHCPYCNTDYAREESKCPSCQAADYENRCVGCTTVFTSEHCPSCGLGVSETLLLCPKCGKRMKGSQCPDCLEIETKKSDEAARVALGEQEYTKNQAFLAKSKVTPTGSCLPLLHSWRGCTCTRCGKKKDDGEHDWLGCTCKICGEVHDSDHSFFPVSVGGNIERCVICGKTRDVKVEAAKTKRNRLFLTIALLIFFPPVGIILTWLFQKEWKPETKKKISIASSIWLIVAIIAIAIMSAVLPGVGNSLIVVTEGYAMVPAASNSLLRRDFQEVVADFEAAGFINITTEGMGDLITGWLTRDGSVREVSIDGISSFDADRVFPVDVEIVIIHHSFP